MERTIIAALAAGAAAAAQDVTAQGMKDAYAGLKALIARKLGNRAGAKVALDRLDEEPDSKDGQEALKEVLKSANASQDDEIVRQAQALLDLLKQYAPADRPVCHAVSHGDGAIAQGPGAVAAGAGGAAIGGRVSDSTIITGSQNPAGVINTVHGDVYIIQNPDGHRIADTITHRVIPQRPEIRTREHSLPSDKGRDAAAGEKTFVRKIRIFLSSPGDVDAERQKVGAVVAQIERMLGNRLGFSLELVEWTLTATSAISRRRQDIWTFGGWCPVKARSINSA
ncbi:MAG: hypothetical protein AB1611_17600 [bacterium]